MTGRKFTRTLENAGVVESRYNKALVCSQLKGIFFYETDKQLYDDANKIMLAWEKSHADKDQRERFFNVQEVLGLPYKLFVLVSGYGKWMTGGYDYDILQFTHSKYIKFGVPVNKAVLKHIGDVDIIARILIRGGIDKLIELIEIAVSKVEAYEIKDKLNHNLALLMNLREGLYDETIFE